MKLMRRLFLVFAVCVFTLSLISFFSVRNERLREVPSGGAAASAAEGYLVCSEGERLCVLPLPGGEPRYIEGVRVSDLPDEDRQLLAEGLAVANDAELYALLEDYTG